MIAKNEINLQGELANKAYNRTVSSQSHQVSIPSFQENLVRKMKYIPNAMKSGT